MKNVISGDIRQELITEELIIVSTTNATVDNCTETSDTEIISRNTNDSGKK